MVWRHVSIRCLSRSIFLLYLYGSRNVMNRSSKVWWWAIYELKYLVIYYIVSISVCCNMKMLVSVSRFVHLTSSNVLRYCRNTRQNHEKIYPISFDMQNSAISTWIRYNGIQWPWWLDDFLWSFFVGGSWGIWRLPCFADSSRWPWPLYDSLDVGVSGGGEKWHWKCVLFVHVCSTWPLQL